MNTTANQPHKPLTVGDYVIVGREEEYAGLVGQVKEIIRFGSPEHDTGNPTDDIIVDLSQAPYSDEKKVEILALANELGYDADSYDDVPLDSVILAPDDLVRITSHEYELYSTELMSTIQSGVELAERLTFEHFNELSEALTSRVEQNFANYESVLLNLSPREIFNSAPKTHAYSEAYNILTYYHVFSEDELRFFLQFEYPLDIVAEHCFDKGKDISDKNPTIEFIMKPERQKLILETEIPYELRVAQIPKRDESSAVRGNQSTSEKRSSSLLRELSDAKTEAAARNAVHKNQPRTKNQGDKDV